MGPTDLTSLLYQRRRDYFIAKARSRIAARFVLRKWPDVLDRT
jgi:hypothetical protein